jgi:uncharacterized protein YukE
MSGFTTDHEALARQARTFTGLSERADGILATLNTELASYGACWGGDAPGQAFARSHVEPAGATLTGMGELPDGLRGIGDTLAATAATYADSEHTSRDAVHTAGRDLV